MLRARTQDLRLCCVALMKFFQQAPDPQTLFLSFALRDNLAGLSHFHRTQDVHGVRFALEP